VGIPAAESNHSWLKLKLGSCSDSAPNVKLKSENDLGPKTHPEVNLPMILI
jgi:hypothetical protein